MELLYAKILVVLIIFFGESLTILAEMIAARTFSIASHSFLDMFIKMFLIFAFAGGALIFGYMFGFISFKNIWIVSVISITSILISEPILAYVFFQQLPTSGALIGLIFGVLGFVSTMFF